MTAFIKDTLTLRAAGWREAETKVERVLRRLEPGDGTAIRVVIKDVVAYVVTRPEERRPQHVRVATFQAR